jgi:hypothetical protein
MIALLFPLNDARMSRLGVSQMKPVCPLTRIEWMVRNEALPAHIDIRRDVLNTPHRRSTAALMPHGAGAILRTRPHFKD